MGKKVLIIDDEQVFREDLASLLRKEGYDCETAECAEEGLECAERFEPDAILCDMVMPGMNGVGFLDEMAQRNLDTPVILITAFGTLQTAVEAFRKGAADYIMKPLVVEDVIQKLDRLIEYKRLSQEVKFLRRELSRDVEYLPVVGQSEAMKGVFDLVQKVAPTRSTVLITGESGTGKELIARAIHQLSGSADPTFDGPKNDLPFVAINCAGIPGELLESELFGHVRGAFTGAIKDRVGHFELALNGAILLDEVGEMPLNLQSKLLRVLEEKEFVRVGGSKPIPLSARIIAATNSHLKALVENGKFREDLFYRLAVFEIALPPLRKRRSDIPSLVDHFIEKLNRELKRECRGVDPDAMTCLLNHPWPGNVRELRNVIERAMILSQGNRITLANLPGDFLGISAAEIHTDELREATRAFESSHIRRILVESGWNKEETARRLGVNPSTLYRKMADLGLPHDAAPTSASQSDA